MSYGYHDLLRDIAALNRPYAPAPVARERSKGPQVASIIGVDLAQTHDYSAISISECTTSVDDRPIHAVRHLERLPIGTDYTRQVERIRELVALKPGSELVVDQTGVGRAVIDIMREKGLKPRAVTITGGDHVARDETSREYRVPKRDLVTAMQLSLQTQRLKVAKSLRDAQRWADELLAFQVEITASGHDRYGNDATLAGHDDLVIATALCVWWGENTRPLQLFI